MASGSKSRSRGTHRTSGTTSIESSQGTSSGLNTTTLALLIVGGIMLVSCLLGAGIVFLGPVGKQIRDRAQKTAELDQQRKQQQAQTPSQTRSQPGLTAPGSSNARTQNPTVQPKVQPKPDFRVVDANTALLALSKESKYQLDGLRWISRPSNKLSSSQKETVNPQLLSLVKGEHGKQAAQALRNTAGESEVSAILVLIDDPQAQPAQTDLFKVLQEVKPVSAIPSLVEWMQMKERRGLSVSVLDRIGPKIIPAVLPLLNHEDFFIRTDAYRLLTKHGVSDQQLLTQCIKDLESKNAKTLDSSISIISKQQQTEANIALVSPGLTSRLEGMEKKDQHRFMKLLLQWGRSQDMAPVAKFLENSDRGTVTLAIRVLAATQATEYSLAIAEKLNEFFLRGEARKALISFGPEAEQPVLKVLLKAGEDRAVFKETCLILSQIGGQRSIQVLQRLMKLDDPQVKRETEKALKAIQTRLASQ